MKYLLILLFGFSAFAQSDSISRSNISVISAEKLNVVYRGIDNPIKIAVPGAKSFTASGSGLNKIDDNGNYSIAAGSGLEVKVTIEAIMQDETLLHEEKTFRIKGLSRPEGLINDIGKISGYPIKITKDELSKTTINLGMPDFLFDVNLIVTRFTLFLPDKTKILIEGNVMNDEAIRAIKKLRTKSVVVIDSIRYGDPLTCGQQVSPIIVEIVK
jgi:hypothetical protein